MSRGLAALLKLTAVVCLLGGAAIFVLRLNPRGEGGLTLPEVAIAGTILLVGLASGAGLWAVASLGTASPHNAAGDDGEVFDAIHAVRASVSELNRKLDELNAEVRKLQSPTPQGGPASNDGSLRALQRAIDELREVAVLPDRLREERLAKAAREQRQRRLTDAAAFLDAGDLSGACRAIDSLELHFAADADVVELRRRYDAAREQAKAQSLHAERERVEGLMSVGKWADAVAAAEKLANTYPESPEAQAMLGRVRRERAVFLEGLVGRLYEQVKDESERRNWRKALAAAKRLIEEAPDHPRSAKVAPTIATLEENAQIQDRQERESQIQELIKSKRLDDALELSEELIAKYPDSPQAKSLRPLLPKLREAAIRSEISAGR
jgi:tetratricopeptide (TPR) repeat protein